MAQTFGRPWLDKADIQKSKDVLEVRGVLIRLSDDTMSYKDKQVKVPVTESFDRHSPILIVQKPRQLDETYMQSFAKDHRGLIQRLVFSMVSDDSVDSDTLRILAQDDTSREALEDTRTQFEQRYNIFSKKNKTV
ncbi:MAG: hypothetical protein WAM14_17710 [Candidatus Nitrosopolaris sp.]